LQKSARESAGSAIRDAGLPSATSSQNGEVLPEIHGRDAGARASVKIGANAAHRLEALE
jgi:hypothetical protein